MHLPKQFPAILYIALSSLPSPSSGQANDPLNDLEKLDTLFSTRAEELLNVETSLGTGIGKGWLETPSATYVLTHRDLMDSGHTHIADQLRMVPGMMVSQGANNSWSVATRSFQHRFAKMQLVLQDGREIYNPMFGGVLWDIQDLPAEILDSVEVIRGPGAVFYGTNAGNGIINMRTLEAKNAQDNLLTLGAGNEGYGKVSFRQGGEIFGGHYYTWGKWDTTRSLHQLPDGSHPDSDLTKVGLRADLPGFGEEGWTFRAEYLEHRGHHRFFTQTLDGTAPQPTLPDLMGDSRTRGAMVQGEWDGEAAWGIDWHLNASYSYDDREYDALPLDLDVGTFELDFQLGKHIGRHDLLGGFRYKGYDYGIGHGTIAQAYTDILGNAATPLLTFPNGDDYEHIETFFLQDTIDLPHDFHLLLALKYDDMPVEQDWMPSARLWWTPNSKTTIWGAISQSKHLPAYDSRYAVSTPGYTETSPGVYTPANGTPRNSALPTELYMGELGCRHLFSSSLSAEVSLFAGKFNDMLLLIGGPREDYNSAKTHGGEFALQWSPSRCLEVRPSISYSNNEIDGPSSGTDEYSRAKWRGNLIATYCPLPDWTCQLGLYSTERAYDQVPGYLRTDLGAKWTPDLDWEVSFYVRNLFDPSHPEDYTSIHGMVVHEVPRTAYLQLRRWF